MGAQHPAAICVPLFVTLRGSQYVGDAGLCCLLLFLYYRCAVGLWQSLTNCPPSGEIRKELI